MNAIPGSRAVFEPLAAASSGRLLPYFESLARRYGAVSTFRLGAQRVVLLDDAALIEHVLVTRQREFVRDSGAQFLKELVGEGLLTTEDPAHVRRRRLMQPAFHRARVASYAATIVAETERVMAGWTSKRSLDIGAEMTRLTLAAVGAALFGADLSGEAGAVADVLARVVNRGASLGALFALAAPMLGAAHRLFPKRRSLLFPAERAELDDIVRPIVDRRRREGAHGNDLLSLLISARDENGDALDDESVRNEAVMLVLAGHETTANALSWTWYALAEHPEIEARLHAEVDAVTGGRTPAMDDVAALRYVSQVFDESLRLYPPATAFGRRPLHDVELGGYAISKMTSIFVSPYVTHRNPRYFPEPLAFRPERWDGAPPPKFAYFPFGGGSKMCIGEPFARLEAVLALATIARRFRLRRIESGRVEESSRAVLRPARPILVEPVERGVTDSVRSRAL